MQSDVDAAACCCVLLRVAACCCVLLRGEVIIPVLRQYKNCQVANLI